MKRIVALIFTLIFFTFNIFAAGTLKTSEYWLAEAKAEACEEINLYFSYDIDKIQYYGKHISDDVFYKKLLDGKKFSRFIYEDEWDCIVDGEAGYEKDGYYFMKIVYRPYLDETRSDTHYQTPLPLNDEWFAALDEALLSGELGKITNVSFLSYDVDNRRVQTPEIDESLLDNVTDEFYSAWFAYIESDTGEYLFPCVIEGNMGIESGKVYELYECAEIMNANMYVVEDFYAELVEDEAPNVWYFVAAFVIVLAGICVAVILIRKAKKKKGA